MQESLPMKEQRCSEGAAVSGSEPRTGGAWLEGERNEEPERAGSSNTRTSGTRMHGCSLGPGPARDSEDSGRADKKSMHVHEAEGDRPWNPASHSWDRALLTTVVGTEQN